MVSFFKNIRLKLIVGVLYVRAKVISFLKEKNWWYQDESIDYRNVLSNLGVDMN